VVELIHEESHMTMEESQKLKIPGFKYRGFDIPGSELSPSLIDNLGTSDWAYAIAPKSVPLAWKVGLYMVGRDLDLLPRYCHLRFSKETKELPEPVKEAGRVVYSHCHQREEGGVWHKDGVLIVPRSEAPKGILQPKDDNYTLARYFKDIDSFEEKNGVWTIKPSAQTEETLVWLPRGFESAGIPTFDTDSYIVPTMDGAYNPITGTPFETIVDRTRAIKRWVKAGLSEQQAEKELSVFYKSDHNIDLHPLEEYTSIRAVYSWSSSDGGPLCIGIDYTPWKFSRPVYDW
jgi:hypothetical protein